MATTQKSNPRNPADDIVEYRAISATAIVGIVLAVVSVITFAHPVFWIVPVVAVVVCLVALWQIARHAPELIGRRAAIIGLALSIVLGIAAPTRHFILVVRSRFEARQLALFWLNAVRQHDLKQAVEFMRDVSVQKLSGEEDEVIEREGPMGPRARGPLPITQVVRAIEELGESAEIRYIDVEEQTASSSNEKIVSLWEVSAQHDGKPKSMRVRLWVDRNARAPRSVREWRVASAQFVDKAPEWLSPPHSAP